MECTVKLFLAWAHLYLHFRWQATKGFIGNILTENFLSQLAYHVAVNTMLLKGNVIFKIKMSQMQMKLPKNVF